MRAGEAALELSAAAAAGGQGGASARGQEGGAARAHARLAALAFLELLPRPLELACRAERRLTLCSRPKRGEETRRRGASA